MQKLHQWAFSRLCTAQYPKVRGGSASIRLLNGSAKKLRTIRIPSTDKFRTGYDIRMQPTGNKQNGGENLNPDETSK